MWITRIIAILLMALLPILGACTSPITAPTTPAPPTPTPALPPPTPAPAESTPTPTPTPTPAPTQPPAQIPKTVTPTQPTSPTPETWNTYFNPVYPYSIEYPDGWRVDDSVKSLVFINNPNGPWLGIYTTEPLKYGSLTEYISWLITWNSNNKNSFTLISTRSSVHQGQLAWELTYTYIGITDKSVFWNKELIIPTPAYLYKIIYLTTLGSRDVYSPVFERILSSFRFVQAAPAPTPTPTPTPTPAPTATPAPAPNTWIDAYYATNGELPPVPDWMLPLMPELKAGDRFRKGVIFLSAGAQYWARRSPTEKEMILETVLWLGGDPNDYLWEMEQRRPP